MVACVPQSADPGQCMDAVIKPLTQWLSTVSQLL